MIFIKVAFSAVSAKVIQHLNNPRYVKNHEKLEKILERQTHKKLKRDEILGKDTADQLEGIGVGEEGSILNNSVDAQRLRDKLLEWTIIK